jgi:hypothetical protein
MSSALVEDGFMETLQDAVAQQDWEAVDAMGVGDITEHGYSDELQQVYSQWVYFNLK